MWRFGVPYVLVMPLVSSGISWKGDMLRKATKLFVYTVLYSVLFFYFSLSCHCTFFVLRNAQGDQRKVKRRSGSLLFCLYSQVSCRLARKFRPGTQCLQVGHYRPSYDYGTCLAIISVTFYEIIVVRGQS